MYLPFLRLTGRYIVPPIHKFTFPTAELSYREMLVPLGRGVGSLYPLSGPVSSAMLVLKVNNFDSWVPELEFEVTFVSVTNSSYRMVTNLFDCPRIVNFKPSKLEIFFCESVFFRASSPKKRLLPPSMASPLINVAFTVVVVFTLS